MIDRGNKKWTAMMMPEHLEMLHEIFEEEQKIDKPTLSEDQYHEMQITINEALQFKKKLDIVYWNNHRLHTIEGFIDKIKGTTLYVDTSDGIDLLEINKVMELSLCDI
ncbi:YolD-like family protein [Gracilibacillus lacisalsi]|uniref:YolD-like family protein n=1 Tax=Gracilibacillus lacisalsi TaxID=393087 RepID=UPI000361D32E|nr:YolD-like family protein [Gracilibacillus lacisalsi]